MTRAIFFILFLLPSLGLFAQFDYNNCYGVGSLHVPKDIIIDSSKNYVVTGGSSQGAIFLKFNSLGWVLQEKAIEKNDLRASNIVEFQLSADETGYLISGRNYIYGEPGFFETFLLLVDQNGEELWYNPYPRISETAGSGVGPDRKVIIKDDQAYFTTPDTLRKLDINNRIETKISLGDLAPILSQYSVMRDIASDDDYIYLFVSKFILTLGKSTYYLLKINTDLELVDSYNFNLEMERIIQLRFSDNIGFSISGHAANWDIAFANVSKEGLLKWEKTYDITAYPTTFPHDHISIDDGFLIVGAARVASPWSLCPIIIKTNLAGEAKGYKIIGDCNPRNSIESIIEHDNKIIVAGQRNCQTSGPSLFLHNVDTTWANANSYCCQ